MNSEDTQVVVAEPVAVQLGTLSANSGEALIAGATAIAKPLADLIEKQKLYLNIQGRKHVLVEGWTTLAAMMGCTAQEISNNRQEDSAYVADVGLYRLSDGAIIARASAECGGDGEPEWMVRKGKNVAPYARRSMAATRATAKACRLAFSWVMTLSGYSTTPAEEMGQEVAQGGSDRQGNGLGADKAWLLKMYENEDKVLLSCTDTKSADFVSDSMKRLQESGDNTNFSGPQLAWLRRIFDEYEAWVTEQVERGATPGAKDNAERGE